jgi:hypothetical protein
LSQRKKAPLWFRSAVSENSKLTTWRNNLSPYIANSDMQKGRKAVVPLAPKAVGDERQLVLRFRGPTYFAPQVRVTGVGIAGEPLGQEKEWRGRQSGANDNLDLSTASGRTARSNRGGRGVTPRSGRPVESTYFTRRIGSIIIPPVYTIAHVARP